MFLAATCLISAFLLPCRRGPSGPWMLLKSVTFGLQPLCTQFSAWEATGLWNISCKWVCWVSNKKRTEIILCEPSYRWALVPVKVVANGFAPGLDGHWQIYGMRWCSCSTTGTCGDKSIEGFSCVSILCLHLGWGWSQPRGFSWPTVLARHWKPMEKGENAFSSSQMLPTVWWNVFPCFWLCHRSCFNPFSCFALPFPSLLPPGCDNCVPKWKEDSLVCS